MMPTLSTARVHAAAPDAMPCCDDHQLQSLLHEDVPFGDLTTASLGLSGAPARATFTARAGMTVCGVEEAARLFELCGARVQLAQRSGAQVEADALVLTAEGEVAGVLKAWKTAQTLAESMSGMATAARHIVQALKAEGHDVPVACTRKNFPGTRAFAAKAVRSGGAVMHRLGLSESLLVFPEHLAFIEPDQRPAVLAQLRRRQPEKRLVVEVGSAEDALSMAEAGVDVLQLERFSPAELQSLRASLEARGLRTLLAPAGGVTARNAVDYARAGADFLVSSAPYFAPPADIRVHIGAA